jgi:hypothetical protein
LLAKKVSIAVLILLLAFSVFGCGQPEDKLPEPKKELEDIADSIEESIEKLIQPEDVEGMTEEFAAVIGHMQNQGIGIVDIEVYHRECPSTGCIAFAFVSTENVFFELLYFDLDNLSVTAADFLGTLVKEYDEEYYVKGNIVLSVDRYYEEESEEYTEAIEAIINAFKSSI